MMWLCLALFITRVLGQVYVGLYKPKFLPPWEEWYSGLLAYPLLLLSQVLIIMWMTLIAYDSTRGSGLFYLQDATVIHGIRVFSLVYGTAMVARYCITMWREPSRRWFKGTIPIWFHLVLTTFLFLWSSVGT